MNEQLRITTEDGLSLEAEWDLPATVEGALVFCHPHPQMGGTMNALLLRAVTGRLVQSGWAVLRFNFRGVGDSEGEPGMGDDERKDAIAALEAARVRFPDTPLALAGWSFGAAVAIRVAAERDDVIACIAIAPAIKEKAGITKGLPVAGELRLALPTHLIVGVNDDLVDPDDCEEWAKASGATCEVMPGANHFFWAKYDNLAGEVLAFLDGAVGSESGTGRSNGEIRS